MRNPFTFIPRLWSNWITLLGSVLAGLAATGILVFLGIELASPGANVYANSFLILAMPILFVLGLLFVPLGLWIEHRRRRRAGTGTPPPGSVLEETFRKLMGERLVRRRLLFVLLFTGINVILFSYAGHKATTYMDSPEFWGTACHTTMHPEWDAFRRSSHNHAQIKCVDCHIGPGATWAIKAKLNGLHQLWALMNRSYQRPIFTPIPNLRPSRDICEQCHNADRYTGNRIKLFPHYKPDEKNTPAFNVEVLHIGGHSPRTGKYEGIHSHADPARQIRYEYRDRQWLEIGKITVIEGGKVVAEYLPPEPEAGKPKPGPVLGERRMDCVDCHNRPAHNFAYGPRQAIDVAMYQHELDSNVPYLAEVAHALVTAKDVPADNLAPHFRKALEATYRQSHPDVALSPETLDKTAQALAAIHRRNVFPQMGITWGTYRTHIGHGGEQGDTVGCFRCHDREHVQKRPDGTTKTLSQECDLCHEQLAFEEDPQKMEDTVQLILPH